MQRKSSKSIKKLPSRRKSRKRPKPVNILCPNYVPYEVEYDSSDPYWVEDFEMAPSECPNEMQHSVNIL